MDSFIEVAKNAADTLHRIVGSPSARVKDMLNFEGMLSLLQNRADPLVEYKILETLKTLNGLHEDLETKAFFPFLAIIGAPTDHLPLTLQMNATAAGTPIPDPTEEVRNFYTTTVHRFSALGRYGEQVVWNQARADLIKTCKDAMYKDTEEEILDDCAHMGGHFNPTLGG